MTTGARSEKSRQLNPVRPTRTFADENSHAYELLFFERREFLQSLYDQLPDKSKIVNGKKVVEVLESHDGVSVLLSDGSREEGDVLIGCDGVHSFVRQNMWDQADTVSPGLISISEKKSEKLPFSSPFAVIF